jgi:hypothetical protein
MRTRARFMGSEDWSDGVLERWVENASLRHSITLLKEVQKELGVQ